MSALNIGLKILRTQSDDSVYTRELQQLCIDQLRPLTNMIKNNSNMTFEEFQFEIQKFYTIGFGMFYKIIPVQQGSAEYDEVVGASQKPRKNH